MAEYIYNPYQISPLGEVHRLGSQPQSDASSRSLLTGIRQQRETFRKEARGHLDHQKRPGQRKRNPERSLAARLRRGSCDVPAFYQLLSQQP